VLITEARRSIDEEFSSRRRRYLIMMAGRAVCVIAAVLVYNVSIWLAGLFLVGAAVLPWAAVLIANDRPAKQAVRFRRFLPGEHVGPAELNSGAEPRPESDDAERQSQDRASTRPPGRPADPTIIDV
jgi:hypothetical protein